MRERERDTHKERERERERHTHTQGVPRERERERECVPQALFENFWAEARLLRGALHDRAAGGGGDLDDALRALRDWEPAA